MIDWMRAMVTCDSGGSRPADRSASSTERVETNNMAHSGGVEESASANSIGSAGAVRGRTTANRAECLPRQRGRSPPVEPNQFLAGDDQQQPAAAATANIGDQRGGQRQGGFDPLAGQIRAIAPAGPPAGCQRSTKQGHVVTPRGVELADDDLPPPGGRAPMDPAAAVARSPVAQAVKVEFRAGLAAASPLGGEFAVPRQAQCRRSSAGPSAARQPARPANRSSAGAGPVPAERGSSAVADQRRSGREPAGFLRRPPGTTPAEQGKETALGPGRCRCRPADRRSGRGPRSRRSRPRASGGDWSRSVRRPVDRWRRCRWAFGAGRRAGPVPAAAARS